MAHALPHGGFVLAVRLGDGLPSLAGALTYAELGAMYRAPAGSTSSSRRHAAVYNGARGLVPCGIPNSPEGPA